MGGAIRPEGAPIDEPSRSNRTSEFGQAGTVVVASTGAGPFDQIMLDGRHSLRADEPATAGGSDAGPGPY